MNLRTTWYLLGLAAALLLFIVLFERPAREVTDGPNLRVLPELKASEVASIAIRPVGGVEIRAERRGKGWRLVKPLDFPGFAERIDGLLEQLEALEWRTEVTAAELKNRPNAQEEFGLTTPRASVLIEQEGSTMYLVVGSIAAFGDEVFVQRVGAPGIYMTDLQWLYAVPAHGNAWRDPAIVRLEGGAAAVDGIRVKSGESRYGFERDSESGYWRLSKPLETRADHARVMQLLGDLGAARAVDFVSDDPGAELERFGLRAPELELVLASGTNDVAAFHVGRSPPDDPAHVYLRRAGEPSVLLAPRQPFEGWRSSHGEFRERRLLGVSPEEIGEIQFAGAGGAFSVRKREDGLWVVEPERALADADLVEGWLRMMAGIAVEFERAVVTDFGSYGLDAPALTLAFLGKEEGGRARAFGTMAFSPRDEKAFVRHDGEGSVSAITLPEFRRFPKAPWQFRGRRVWTFDSSEVFEVTIRQKGHQLKLVRNQRNEWIIAPGFQGIVEGVIIEETLHRLGDLHAIVWHARDGETDRFGFQETDHQVDLKLDGPSGARVLTIEFGWPSDFHHPYAAALVDGRRTVFEFPWALFHELVYPHLTIPAAKALSAN